MQPEEELARRLVLRRSLVPKVDVLGILNEFAKVEFVDFPFRADGLCLDLKALGKKPTVLVNRSSNPLRQRFTLAHELGHVLIPWHIGQIVDEIELQSSSNFEYAAVEHEADRFASELLMPTSWVKQQIGLHGSPIDALWSISSIAHVSFQAASIKLMNCLPKDYVIAVSSNDIVARSSRSEDTLAGTISAGYNLRENNPFPVPCEYWSRHRHNLCYHIWHLAAVDMSPQSGEQPWRAILDCIVVDIIPDSSDRELFKQSVAAISASANSRVRSNRTPEIVATAILHRLYARVAKDRRYSQLVKHPDFKAFYEARARAFKI